MLVEIQTPTGVVQGTATRRLAYTDGKELGWFPLAQGRPKTSVRGSAVLIDLPDRRKVYALMTGADGFNDYAENIAPAVISDFWSRPTASWVDIDLCPPDRRPPAPGPSLLPRIVVFGDARRFATMQIVDPCAAIASAAAGFAIRRIAVRTVAGDDMINDAPLPSVLDDRAAVLRWYRMVPQTDPRHVSREDFTR